MLHRQFNCSGCWLLFHVSSLSWSWMSNVKIYRGTLKMFQVSLSSIWRLIWGHMTNAFVVGCFQTPTWVGFVMVFVCLLVCLLVYSVDCCKMTNAVHYGRRFWVWSTTTSFLFDYSRSQVLPQHIRLRTWSRLQLFLFWGPTINKYTQTCWSHTVT